MCNAPPKIVRNLATDKCQSTVMKACVKQLFAWWLMLLLSASVTFAQTPEPLEGNSAPPTPESAQPVFSQEELDQMLAPIALYPDALLSQILMAATYPLEVVEAARWSKANPNLRGDRAVNAVAQNNWDPSVKSLVAFPQIIQMMDDKLDWTERLGDAFLSQQPQVMDTVQNLRQRAYAAGNLRSTDQIRVETQGQTIVVAPANPEIIYVPYYNPTVIYGTWWWPAYPPVYWGPWPGYHVRPGITVGFFFGAGVAIAAHFFFGEFDWHARHVNVVQVNNFYFNYNAYVNRERAIYQHVNVTNNRVAWGHDPDHRRGVPYRTVALREQYRRVSAAPETRRDFRGYAPPSPQVSSQRQATGQQHIVEGARPNVSRESRNRPEEQANSSRATGGSTGTKAPTGVASSHPSVTPPAGRLEASNSPRRPAAPTVQPQPTAFDGVGQGAEVRNQSARGRKSYQAAAAPKTSATPAHSSSSTSPAKSSATKKAPQPAGNSSSGNEGNRH